MKPEDYQRLVILLTALWEFREGRKLAGMLWRSKNTPIYMRCFIGSATHYYLHSFYMANPGSAIPDLLRSIGRADLADSMVAILDSPIGATRYRDILSHIRNKAMARYVPNLKLQMSGLEDGWDMFHPDHAAALTRADRKLSARTVAVLRYVERIYPDLIAQIDPRPFTSM
jgi:hypothetical protein